MGVKTTIKVFNDTNKDLTVRLPPTAITVAPKKMIAVFIEGDDVFFKIWDGNVIMFKSSKDIVDLPKTSKSK